MTDKLLTGLKRKITEFKLIPAAGGCFEVTVNGELIYSKLATGQFPNEAAVMDLVKARLK